MNDSVDGSLCGTRLLVAADRFPLCKHDITMLMRFGLVCLPGNLKTDACPHVCRPQKSGQCDPTSIIETKPAQFLILGNVDAV